MPRPPKNIDPNLVRNLASIHCTTEEIAIACGVSSDTIERRFMDMLIEGRAIGKTSLRRYMWKAATEKSNVTMMIWLSKQLLGYTDKQEQKIDVTSAAISDKELITKTKEMISVLEKEQQYKDDTSSNDPRSE